MEITAKLVKELRERTDCGMMECKKALVETNGDIDAAIDLMRKNGQAKADKKASRAAAEGMLLVRQEGTTAIIVEVNCETDFVTKNEDYLSFANEVADLIISNKPASIELVGSLPMRGKTVDEVRNDLISKIGENISVRRMALLESDNILGVYTHGIRIASIVELKGSDIELAKDIAMHVAASKPICLDSSEVPVELLDKEREIYSAQASESGKPADIVAKMVEGRMRKYLEEVTLLGQNFVKDPDITVEKLLKSKNATVVKFIRFGLGEGVEIIKTDFAAEVMAQAGL
ncbi:translation elongation factor EF-Ts [Gammaproteobacteria bacterium]|nr:translation elongation factor EF-Ts [Gammaproteobacteria bacterium]